jgi:hypothetical protein
MEPNSKSNDSDSKAITEASQLADRMLEIAEKGIVSCEDDGCMMVYGIIRDCGYKIRRTVDQEQVFDNKSDDYSTTLQ